MSMAVQTQAKAAPTIKPVPLHTQSGLLQRACACGGTPGVDGECTACRAQRLQRKAISSLPSLRPTLTTHQGLLQRCGADGECAECRAKRLSMQRGTAASAVSTASVPPIVHDVLGSSGHPLDAGARSFMEPRFGHDFSHVRVHTDAKAAESAHAVNALAYTVGRNVVFGTGQYAPGTIEGKRLMAHELTHVVQQSGMSDSSRVQRQIEVGQVNDPAEQEADAQAATVTDSPKTRKASSEKQGDTTLEKPEADISKAPKDMPCIPTNGRRNLAGTDIFFDLASSDIPSKEDVKRTIANRNAIEDFKNKWTRDCSRDDVIVDGYASADGKQEYNWRLSCDRAEAIKDELKSVMPEKKIKTFAHGETDEFSKVSYEPNRHAIITRVPSPNPLRALISSGISCSSPTPNQEVKGSAGSVSWIDQHSPAGRGVLFGKEIPQLGKWDPPPPEPMSESFITGSSGYRFSNYLQASIKTDDSVRITSSDFSSLSNGYGAPSKGDLPSHRYPMRRSKKPIHEPSKNVEGFEFEQTVGFRTASPGEIAAAICTAGVLVNPIFISEGPIIVPLCIYIANRITNFPPIWTDLKLRLWADGRRECELVKRSFFPSNRFYCDLILQGKEYTALDAEQKLWEDNGWGPGNPWGDTRHTITP